MTDPVLRIFSYLPNPRVWKSLIAAEYCGVNVEVIGAQPAELADWLWDFDARELAEDEKTDDSPHLRQGKRGYQGKVYKTDAFLQAQPFGTVPAAFDPTGEIGIFESNSILRAVARSGGADHGLYGTGVHQASRVDSFLDAGLVFAREAQVYMLAMPDVTAELYERMAAAYEFYLSGINRALSNSPFITGPSMTIADIAFTCDLAQFCRELEFSEGLASIGKDPICKAISTEFPAAYRHLMKLSQVPRFDKHLSPLTGRLAAIT